MVPKTIGLIVFEQANAGELTGSAQVFSRAKVFTRDAPEMGESPCYRVRTLGIGIAPCTTDCGVILKPQLDINDAPPLHTLIVPGGIGIQKPRVIKKLTRFLARRAPITGRIVTFGSGIYPLAATGLLDGRHVTTHWRIAKELASRFPKLRVTSNNLFVRDGPFYTCAGGSAALDLTLSLIEEDFGRQVALKLAQEFVVHFKRPGEQEQYSEALRFQIQSCDRFADISTWILCNLSGDLSVDALAHRTCMSPRNFTRLFKAAFGRAPAEFVTSARITEARRRLEVPRNNIESVAASVGFQSADAFSRAFKREVGCRPSTYRERLGVVTAEFRLFANDLPSPGFTSTHKPTAGSTAAATNRRDYKFRRQVAIRLPR
jgi:transcriptional regulator GlxA family with amidase domain